MGYQPSIPQNNPMRMTIAFVDDTNAPFDPVTGIKCVVRDPKGGVGTFDYPADLVRDSVGVYHLDVMATLDGSYIAYGQGQLSNGDLVTTDDLIQPVTPSSV